MADIAMLVVEEFERKRERGDELKKEVRELIGSMASMSSSFTAKISSMLMKRDERGLEPRRSPLVLAAFDGFFSS